MICDSMADDDDAILSYDCYICFDTALYPVLTTCGHLYCWTCLTVWIKTLKLQERDLICPACKKTCNEHEDIIPVYGRGDQNLKDFDVSVIPKRPLGKRPKVTASQQQHEYPYWDQLGSHSAGFRIFSRNIIISTAESRLLPTIYIINEIPSSIIIEIGQLGFISRLLLMAVCLHVVVSIFC